MSWLLRRPLNIKNHKKNTQHILIQNKHTSTKARLKSQSQNHKKFGGIAISVALLVGVNYASDLGAAPCVEEPGHSIYLESGQIVAIAEVQEDVLHVKETVHALHVMGVVGVNWKNSTYSITV